MRDVEREEHYDLCAEARDGAEAVALAIKHKPDLIILDMLMPRMDGIHAAKKLKELMPEVPIILLTLYAEAVDPDSVAANRIISKHQASSLMNHVRQLLPV